MISMFVFAYKIIRPIIFSAVKKVTFSKEIFNSQGIFPQSKNFSTIKKIFHCQHIFPPSRNFFTIKDIFYSQGIFPQSRKFFTAREFQQSKNFSTVKKVSTDKGYTGSLKAKSLDPFNAKSYAKIFLTL